MASDNENKQKQGSYYNKLAAPAPPFPHIVIMILPATYCDPARFMSSTSSHAIVVVVVVRIIIVSVRVAVIVAAM